MSAIVACNSSRRVSILCSSARIGPRDAGNEQAPERQPDKGEQRFHHPIDGHDTDSLAEQATKTRDP